VVTPGQVLISGATDAGVHGSRFCCAAGSVIARTVRTVTVEVPLAQEQAVAGEGRDLQEISLIFFGKTIKLFGKTGNVGGSCDTIEWESFGTLPGGVVLPVGIRVRMAVERSVQTVDRTAEQAAYLAGVELDRQIAALDGYVLLRKNLQGEWTDEVYHLEGTLLGREEIARTQEFELD
jgi:hypothetical protein